MTDQVGSDAVAVSKNQVKNLLETASAEPLSPLKHLHPLNPMYPIKLAR
jgi:hypothetical protein